MRNIDDHFTASSKLIKQSLPKLRIPISQAAKLITQTFKSGGKLLICGNGGSAAQSQHFAAELVGRYQKERKAMPAIALTTDTSALTAIANDYGFDKVFSRQVEAVAKQGDVLFCISTSGNSPNILAAAKAAKSLQVKTISLTGNGGKLKNLCNINLIIPSNKTPLIQEVHLVIIHTLCELIESSL
ncbi:MAG: D-sedoheptulose 7-phosphate isomerase [Microgenomates group bacterium Gr01-1014_16]|nr:MAG: D-sedoheptulose 7-phosphate isomerase [Microgenomates group bacterium Gr01-1014_16]